MADQQFCLRWNNHQSTLISVFDSLLERGAMVDCTLAAEGQCLQAHKVVLSACSPYLETLLSQHYDKHPILLLKDVKFYELQAMMDYMYRGEVNVAQDKLGMFLKAAESLQIKGLSDSGGNEPPDTGGGSSVKRTNKGAPVSNIPPRSSGGLTVERRRPQQPQTSQVVDIPSDSGSRDGSESPSLRRKRRRRTSGGEDSAIEGDVSNSGEGSRIQPSSNPSSDPVPMNGAADNNPLGILSSLMDGSVETDTSVQEPGPPLGSSNQPQPSQRLREKTEPASGHMIQPKSEYLESEENIEDLTLDDDNGMDNMSGMEAGPSQRQGSGYQWHMGDQGADEVFMAAQEAVGANRDSQGESRRGSHSLGGLPRKITAPGKKWKEKSSGCLFQSSIRLNQNVMQDDYLKEREAADVLTYLSNGSPGPEVVDQSYSEDGWLTLSRDSMAQEGEGGMDWSVVSLQSKLGKRSPYEGPGSFPCENCGKIYKWRRTLQNHLKMECGKDPQFQCPYCPLRSKRKGNLSAHIKAVHGAP